MTILMRGSAFLVATLLLLAPNLAEASIISLLSDGTDLSAWNFQQDTGNGTTYGVDNVAGPTPFGSGDAVRIYDLDSGDKPDLQGTLASPLLQPFRIDFLSLDQSMNASSSAIRFRMGNSGDELGAESRSAFSISWQANGEFTVKYDGDDDANATDIDTLNSAALVGVQSITMVANGMTSGDYTYTLFSQTRTLHALHYDVFINGVLLNSGAGADFANGMQFHYDASGNTYDESLGLGNFGLVGSSNANVDPDYLFDNILLMTGGNIPEPSAMGLLAFSILLVRPALRRRLADSN